MHNRQQNCEECKNEYALELQKCNDVQREHFEVLVPQTFQVSQSKALPKNGSHLSTSIPDKDGCMVYKYNLLGVVIFASGI